MTIVPRNAPPKWRPLTRTATSFYMSRVRLEPNGPQAAG